MKIAIHTFGCKVNQYESDSIACLLEKKGFEVTSQFENADIYIINTCAVTNEAEKKSRQFITKCVKINPNCKILICGCASQKDPNQFIKYKNVVFVCGVANKNKIADIIENESYNKKIEIDKTTQNYNENYKSKPSKTRAYIKIQDGCNNYCSYCIIPYLRGRSRSRNLIEILNEVENLKKHAKEIVITGINLSDYKIDGKNALSKLLLMLKDYDVRFRLGSLEENVINKEFINVIENMTNLCPHFHLSLQSGSNTVLKRMNRNYTTQEFFESVKKLREVYVNPCISTDIIVGFPGETEEEFNETIEFIKKVEFSFIHCFPYSKREGTVASKFKDLNGKIKENRIKFIEKLNQDLIKKFIKKSKKSYHSVLIEEFNGNYYIGHSENYIKCYIKSKKDINLNSFINVKIKKQYLDGAICKPLR